MAIQPRFRYRQPPWPSSYYSHTIANGPMSNTENQPRFRSRDPLRPISQRMWPAETYLTKNVTRWDLSHKECDPLSPISQRMWPAETYLTKNVTRWVPSHKERATEAHSKDPSAAENRRQRKVFLTGCPRPSQDEADGRMVGPASFWQHLNRSLGSWKWHCPWLSV